MNPSVTPVEGAHRREIDPSAFHVMVADDQLHLREIIGRVLAKDGYRVTLVEDGDELLERARQTPPDLVVLDVMMPRLDGLSALREMRSDPRLQGAYVLILSGRSTLEEKLEGFETGADDYLTKPYSVDELRARVRSGIRLRAVERHLELSQNLVVRQEKMATIGILAAGIAHEFNNIMSGIAGFAQLARRNEKYRERLVDVALDQSRRAEKITSSLSSFASTASPRAEFTSLQPLVEAAETLTEKRFAQKDIEFTTDIEDGLPQIELNRGQFQQVLLHLLLNALDATPRGGRVALRLGTDSDRLVLEVDDDGPGVARKDATRIFDPFFTTKGTLGGTDGDGTGLGLTFSLNVIEAHRGTLELAPSKLGGACFRVRLPLPIREERAADAPVAAEDAPRNGTRHRLVMVEDDVTLQEVVLELLEDTEVHFFTAGPEAVAHCRDTEVDALLLDINLDGPWDGWRVLEELRALPSPPPVILTTGSIEVDTDTLADPRVELLRKPFHLDELEAALQRALACGAPAVATIPGPGPTGNAAPPPTA